VETRAILRAGVRAVRPLRAVAGALAMAALSALVPADVSGGEEPPGCEREFPSTFALLQEVIFENRGCTSVTCHDASASGELDLRPEHAYEALIDQTAATVPGWVRVKPGRKDESLLFVNLAARTLPEEWTAPLHGMPLGGLPPILVEELDALRLWIEDGAPRDGVVAGTGELLDACLPPPKPIEIAPLPPPEAERGVQLHMPPWYLPKQSESEVCFTTYYDFTGQVPSQYLSDDGTKFRYDRSEIRQDPVSHHLIVNLYEGEAPVTSPAWGTYRCRGGERDGEECDPLDLDACGEGVGCATDPTPAVGCTGFGPPDAQLGIASGGVTVSQETAADNRFVEGVYDELPLKGVIVWNSHAFNVTDLDARIEAWVNFHFADRQETPVVRIFGEPGNIIDFALTLFKMNAPAFGLDEVCESYQLPPNAHLFELSSHMHKRGTQFRIFHGAFTCSGGPNAGQPCSPVAPMLPAADLCAGFACTAAGPEVGDCDGDGRGSVAELVRAVKIALGAAPAAACPRSDADGDGRTTVDELVGAVAGAMHGFASRDGEDSLLYTNLIYDDPQVLRFDPPMVISPLFPSERTLTYCALYDNGFSDPTEVKRRSTSPAPPLPVGGPCRVPTGCVAGKVKEPCAAGGEEARNASCDLTAGAGDGLCDACPLLGGVTTEDEMFLIMGAYFVP
jgi:hypothetical protein